MTVTQLHPVPRETLVAAHALLVAAEHDARINLAKAATPRSLRRRAVRLVMAADELTAALDDYFSGLAARILPVVKAVAPWDPDKADWARETRLLTEMLRAAAVELGPDAYAGVNAELGLELAFDVRMEGPEVKPVINQIGNDVTGINDVSRQKLRRIVAEGVERGYSLDQLVRGVPDDNFAGLRQTVDGWSSTGAGQGTSRAAMIARTETANVYNHLALSGYDAGGIGSVLVFDGRDCGWTSHEDPDKANGTTRKIADARQHPIAHPNCGRAFGAHIA